MTSSVERIVFPPGTPVFREGEPGDCAYVIERGRVEITSLRSGRPVRLAVLGTRELFGEMALVDDQVRSATATAVEETEVVLVSRARVKAEIQRADPLLHLLLRVTLERLRSTNRRILTHRLGPGTEELGEPYVLDAEYEATRDQAIRRIKLEQELRRALGSGELELRYQPIVSLASRATTGYEALLRWRHPERGLVAPSGFVPLAEETGLIEPMGLWVLEEACTAIAALPADERDAAPYVTVNLSPRQLLDARWSDALPEMLRSRCLEPERLVLEITESALMDDPESARETLTRVRDRGVRLFLDDFGTGYSSLSYLNRFPITGVKLDRSFVASMATEPASLKIARAVAGLARQLDLATVAEGIEEETQASALAEIGFENGQGYLFGRPRERMDGPGA
jgi:EAL domain-containing protein (putative c-di-GMP-specific phosphodiesterase class I)